MYIIITTPAPIHSGDVTHHQDQSIVCVNLRTKNIRNRSVPNPIPLPDDALFAMLIVFNI